ncbi:MAG: ParB/RepB/Spo0J family partition protein [Rhodospirillaceae bacterium]|nr:ParB/RepB/Spo0J family partition protein [Rhodospirillaceae bacterium]
MNAETPKRKTLGRGLNALFGEQDESNDATAGAPARAPGTLPIDLIAPSSLQPRRHFDDASLEELAVSIRDKGILQPLLVRPSVHDAGRYEIVAGERRWRAAQRAQLHNVPAIIRELSDGEVLEIALIENLQRQDLSPTEEARGYRRLMDEFSHTQEQLSDVLGKSRAHIANTLRLLSLPERVQDMIENGKLSVGQARPLIGMRNAETLANTIVKGGLSARQAERLAKGYGKTKRAKLRAEKDADTRALEQTLEDATGYHVTIKFDGKGGEVRIAYANLEQLDDIVKRFSSSGKRAKPEATRDQDTVDLEELLAKTDVEPSEEATAKKDHAGPYEDPAADDVGAGGRLSREPKQPATEMADDFGIADILEEAMNLPADHGGEKPRATPHDDPAVDDTGAGGATHR